MNTGRTRVASCGRQGGLEFLHVKTGRDKARFGEVVHTSDLIECELEVTSETS